MSYRCESCGEPLPPKGKGRRRRYCSDRCKDSGRRQRNFDATGRTRPNAHFVAPEPVEAKTGTTPYEASDMPRKPENSIDISIGNESTKQETPCRVEPFLHRGVRIVPDSNHPGIMWRVELPDGSFSEMVNLTRAKDACVIDKGLGARAERKRTEPTSERMRLIANAYATEYAARWPITNVSRSRPEPAPLKAAA
jgi:hypothetical protein